MLDGDSYMLCPLLKKKKEELILEIVLNKKRCRQSDYILMRHLFYITYMFYTFMAKGTVIICNNT